MHPSNCKSSPFSFASLGKTRRDRSFHFALAMSNTPALNRNDALATSGGLEVRRAFAEDRRVDSGPIRWGAIKV